MKACLSAGQGEACGGRAGGLCGLMQGVRCAGEGGTWGGAPYPRGSLKAAAYLAVSVCQGIQVAGLLLLCWHLVLNNDRGRCRWLGRGCSGLQLVTLGAHLLRAGFVALPVHEEASFDYLEAYLPAHHQARGLLRVAVAALAHGYAGCGVWGLGGLCDLVIGRGRVCEAFKAWRALVDVFSGCEWLS